MKNIFFYLILILLFFGSCANIVRPSGGQRDIQPPKVLKASPENYSKNFKQESFSLNFDEYINIKDPENQVIISPPVDKPVEFIVKKKSLEVLFKDKLKDSTTYTINFGSSINDVNEGNVLEGYQYVFSTGSFIDTLAVTGKVQIAKNNTTEKGVLVMLYRENLDSLPLKKKPLYFTRTNEGGAFRIEHLAKGQYKIFALKDENANYIYDRPGELVGFQNGLIKAGSDSIHLALFMAKPEKIKLERAKALEYGKIQFWFNQPAKNLEIKSLDNALKYVWTLRESNSSSDTITFWYKGIDPDSLHLTLSAGNIFHDTLHLPVIKKETGKKASKKEKKLNMLFNVNGALGLNEKLEIITSHPISQYDLKKAELLEDSVPINDFIILAKDSSLRRFSIVYPWKEGKHYSFLVPKGLFTDYYDQVNDSVTVKFNIIPASEYGNIKLNLKANKRKLIVQLVNEKDIPVREHFVYEDQEIEYPFLIPASYKIKVIEDINSNKQWDAGDYFSKSQPENVFYYKETITVRANWDVQLDWDLK